MSDSQKDPVKPDQVKEVLVEGERLHIETKEMIIQESAEVLEVPKEVGEA